MKASNRKENLLLSIVQEKCPHCGKAHVFRKGTKLFSMPVMNEECSECHYKFNREPGYFLGAMYVSYAIAVFFGILTYLLCHFLFPDIPTGYIPLAIILVILAISKKNFRLSRVIYIHLFPW
jgi:uncharacterized protein (DUF983 family)